MTSPQAARWRPLTSFNDPGVPKLYELGRARRAGVEVPETWWCLAAALDPASPAPLPAALQGQDVIYRSGSPLEDTTETSHAGQLHSEVVTLGAAHGPALGRVVEAMPERAGVVFVQPLVRGARAGVAFFEGFYFERSTATGSNTAITAGEARGETDAGHLSRDDPWSAWLRRLGALYLGGRDGWEALDIEFVERRPGDYVLLQARPALFEVTRNQTLSLANHREILGDLPSPWIVSVLAEASQRVLAYFVQADPTIAPWATTYAVEVGERAWMNFAFFFRLMDHWGLPRSFVTEGVGGDPGSEADQRPDLKRMVFKSPRLVSLQLLNLWTIARIEHSFKALDQQIERADSLPTLFDASVAAMALAVRTNFAINGALTGAVKIRGFLRIRAHSRVVTQDMMDAYEALTALQGEALEQGLDQWLTQFGHRGPLESDPMQPRFWELRDELRDDLTSRASLASNARASANAQRGATHKGGVGWWLKPLFVLDERRERFRDELMHRWRPLRAKILDAGRGAVREGWLDKPEDAFWLRRDSLEGPPQQWRAAVAARRDAQDALRAVALPTTGDRLTLERLARDASQPGDSDEGPVRHLKGISLGPQTQEGVVFRADDLREALKRPERLHQDTILVVPALEPSWALIFPRVGGVVADLGGELSHASILLREARRPALVNCQGAWRHLRDGDRVRIHGREHRLEVLTQALEDSAPLDTLARASDSARSQDTADVTAENPSGPP